jgi:cytochrome bd ubiquinol oxidase subunit II
MDPVADAHVLAIVWFVLVALLWTGYLVLEGFDFGVGMLLRPFSCSDVDRRMMINTIGPVWDGNEVWLIVAVGAMFAAFPEWYATMFSGFYLPVLAILAALIVRGVAFEFRGKVDEDWWRNRWDWAITFGSWTPAIVWGLVFANLVRGVEIDGDRHMRSSLLDLLSPYALLGAAMLTLLCLVHGAVFVALKTDGEIRHRARRLALRLAVPTAAAVGGFALWTQLAYAGHAWTWGAVAVVVAALVLLLRAAREGREGWAFTGTALAIAATVVLVFGALFPDVMTASNDPAHSLTIANAAATGRTLGILTWVAVFLTPLVLGYQGWTYWVFRKRLVAARIPPPAGLRLTASRED